jgi:sirohydrochlorin ferrochelatase
VSEARRTNTPSRRAILIVDHGSRIQEANELLRDVAALVAEVAPDFHVEIAHMELASPTIGEGFAACIAAGARDITVHPYLLAPGRHATDDIPRFVREAAVAHPDIEWRVSAPLGVDVRIAEVIVERVAAARESSRMRSSRSDMDSVL